MPEHQGPSPLQPDPPEPEDIMSAGPRQANTIRRAGETPLPRGAGRREDVLREESPDEAAGAA